MTESDWLSTDSPSRMFRHVRTRLSARKLQLLACGCCRLFDAMLSDEQRRALEVVERHADGLADREEYQVAVEQFGRDHMGHVLPTPTGGVSVHTGVSPTAALAYALMAVVSTPADDGLHRVLDWAAATAARSVGPGQPRAATQAANRKMCGVFREIVANPFRERMTPGPGWVAAGGGMPPGALRVSETARAIALGVQADQAFDRLPILADALEDDGCNDDELLTHLRHHSHHLRGCWAVDLVLGKS
jgi:hypothetical protein